MAISVRNELKEHDFNVELGPYRGGMGEVYEAVSPRYGRVAVKLIRGDCQEEIVTQRFHREIHLLRRLRGASRIVQMLEVGQLRDGRDFVVMDYIGTLSLLDHIRSRNTMLELDEPSEDDQRRFSMTVLDLAFQLSDALCQLHERRVVHRDFNPANVMLRIADPNAREHTFKITVFDFGISNLIRDDEPQDEKESQDMPELSFGAGGLGTPGFVAPEQDVGAPAHPSADIWSFGASLLYMMTGEDRKDRELYCGFFPPRPELRVSGWMHDLALICLQPEPEKRPTAPMVRHYIQEFIRSLREEPIVRPTQANIVTEPVQSFQASCQLVQPVSPIPAVPPLLQPEQASPGPYHTQAKHLAGTAHASEKRRSRWRVFSLMVMMAAVVTAAVVVLMWQRSTPETEPPGVVLAGAVDDGGQRPDDDDKASKGDEVVSEHDEVAPKPRSLKTSTTSEKPPKPKPVPSTPTLLEGQTPESSDQDTSSKTPDKHKSQKSSQRTAKKPKPQQEETSRQRNASKVQEERCDELNEKILAAKLKDDWSTVVRLTHRSNQRCWPSISKWEEDRVVALWNAGDDQACQRFVEERRNPTLSKYKYLCKDKTVSP